MEQNAGSVDVMLSLDVKGMVYRPSVIMQISLGAWNMSGLVGREVWSRELFC